jgi:tol-pal system protein YbgF
MMRRPLALFGVLCIAAAAGPSPAAAANREHDQIMADIRMLQEQTQQLQIALGSLTKALEQINGRLDEQANTNRKSFADQKLLVDTLTSDVRVVREKLDETNVRLTSLSQDVEGVRDMIPQMAAPAQAPSTTGTEPGAVPPAGTPPDAAAPPAPQTPVGTGTTPRRLFELAYADYTAGQWSLSIQGFETYLKTYPKSELADDAQYYIGEAYAGDSKYQEAAAAYEKVIRDYPNGDFVPEAWYKVGVSYERLSQPDKAQHAFEYVIKNYPNSPPATLAKQRLEALTRRAR